jgi:hypothetical protein
MTAGLVIAFNPPQFGDEYEGYAMRALVDELERIHSVLTSQVDDEGTPVGVDDFAGRTGSITPLQADYDSFFLTPAEGNAAYAALSHTHSHGDLTDFSLAGAIDNDLLRRSGGVWVPSAGTLTFDGADFQVTGNIRTANAAGPELRNVAATSVVPTVVIERNDLDTGWGSDNDDQMNAIIGGLEGTRWIESSGGGLQGIVISNQVNDNITASTNQAQGALSLKSSINVVTTVANPNDALTMPSSRRGTWVFIRNDGANNLQLWPDPGEDIGAGTDTSVIIPPGEFREYLSWDALNWTPLTADIPSLASLSDTDLTGAADNDMLYRSGGEWIDTAGVLTFDGSVLETPKLIAGDPGTEGSGITVNGTLYESSAKVSDIGGTNVAQFILHRHSTTLAPVFIGARTKDNTSSHTIMADNDVLLSILAAGWDGADYALSSEILFEVDGTPGIDDMPGMINFRVAPGGSDQPVSALQIRANKDLDMQGGNLTLTGDGQTTGRIIVPGTVGGTVIPTIVFGTDTGFAEHAANQITVITGGSERWRFEGDFRGVANSTPGLKSSAGTSGSTSVKPNADDANTGFVASNDQMWMYVGGDLGLHLREASSQVIHTFGAHQNITASVTQTQGSGVLLSSYNEVRTVANPNDTVTLPSPATSGVGRVMVVVNAGANTLQVFPSLGHDLGQGTNNPTTIEPGYAIHFLGLRNSGPPTWYPLVVDATALALTLDGLTNVDLTGASDLDLLFRSGGEWIDTAGGLTYDGVNDFSIVGTAPRFYLDESDAGTDLGVWRWEAGGSQFLITAVDDARSAGATAIRISRNATPVITNIQMHPGTGDFRVYESAGNDYIWFKHDGTDANIGVQGSAATEFLHFDSQNINTAYRFEGPVPVRIANSARTDWMDLSHDGTDFNIDFVNTIEVNMSGATAGWNFSGPVYPFHANAISAKADHVGFWGDFSSNDTAPRATGENGYEWALTAVHELVYGYDAAITATDPGTGDIKFNSLTPASVTAIYINDVGHLSENAGWVLDNLAIGDTLSIVGEHDELDYLIVTVSSAPTDNTGWWTIPVTVLYSGTIPTDGDTLKMTVSWDSQVGGVTALGDLSDVDLTGVATNDLLYKSAGDWLDTAGVLQFDGTDLILSTGGSAIILAKEDTSTSGLSTNPTIDFQSGDGFYSPAASQIGVQIDDDAAYLFTINEFRGASSAAPKIDIAGTGLTTANFTWVDDENTGVTHASGDTDNLGIVAGGIRATQWIEASSHVLISDEIEVGMTAFATGGQGSATQITSSWSVFSTVAAGGDSSKLPASFVLGTRCYIKNDGAAAMDVFPGSGDDLGAGADTAVSVAAGTSALFVATVANTTWTQWY